MIQIKFEENKIDAKKIDKDDHGKKSDKTEHCLLVLHFAVGHLLVVKLNKRDRRPNKNIS